MGCNRQWIIFIFYELWIIFYFTLYKIYLEQIHTTERLKTENMWNFWETSDYQLID